MDTLTTSNLRDSYTRMRNGFLRTHRLRECECDAMSLYELETDWASLRDRLLLDGVCAPGAELDSHMLMMARDDAKRAREGMFLISDGRYLEMRTQYVVPEEENASSAD